MSDDQTHRSTALRAWALTLTLLAGGCAGPVTTETAQATAAATAEATGTTYVVGVDGSEPDFPASFHRFFPDRLAIAPGDTVVFRRPENGEPHTVTYQPGTPARDAVPGSRFFEGGFGGPPRPDASRPCVLTDDTPPVDGCTTADPDLGPFDGTATWFNSGGLLGDGEFAVGFSDDVPAGSYEFTCLIHTGTMRTTIQVVAPGDTADEPAAVAARAAEQLDRERDKARELVDNPLTVVEGKVTAARAAAGFVAWANTFDPEEAVIPVGGTVTWIVRGMHTVSFGTPESARPYFEADGAGGVRENPLAVEPQGDPEAWDGTGVLHSGLLEGLFPPERFSVTFTQPGTYPYRCVVHFDMEGKIKVVG